MPELNVYKCLQFPSDKVVWDVKQQCLASLPKVRRIPVGKSVLKHVFHFIDFYVTSLLLVARVIQILLKHDFHFNNYIVTSLFKKVTFMLPLAHVIPTLLKHVFHFSNFYVTILFEDVTYKLLLAHTIHFHMKRNIFVLQCQIHTPFSEQF